MTALVLLGYVLSHYHFGVFWPLFLFLLVHILLMSILHLFLSEEINVIREVTATFPNISEILNNCIPSSNREPQKPVDVPSVAQTPAPAPATETEILNNSTKFYNILKILYNCLINGFCNIYVHNFVSFDNNSNEHCHTFWRQFIFNAIFILENTVIIILWHITGIDAGIPNVILIIIVITVFLFGVILKLIYYKFNHLWKNNRAIKDLLPRASSNIPVVATPRDEGGALVYHQDHGWIDYRKITDKWSVESETKSSFTANAATEAIMAVKVDIVEETGDVQLGPTREDK